MAILGTFIDKSIISRAGDGLAGTTLTTAPHSLPATNPDMVLPIMQSIQGSMLGSPELLAIGGNASLVTIGFNNNSLGSMPTLSFTLISQLFYSTIR